MVKRIKRVPFRGGGDGGVLPRIISDHPDASKYNEANPPRGSVEIRRSSTSDRTRYANTPSFPIVALSSAVPYGVVPRPKLATVEEQSAIAVHLNKPTKQH